MCYCQKIKESNAGLFGEVSVRTVSRRTHNLGYTNHHPVKKPLLTLNQKCCRIEFCKKYLQWDADKRLDVLWTNESTFTVEGDLGALLYYQKM
ncbi:Transposable element Tcb1 transposase [Portunus trituberculatus]|uniref:Transposable element Tcb1 transposase n=1 Tax=Portunus trituberculatus TaxID=210409 RepID=A0A5B7JGW3_PORTR|nr:Transposable element Tcb1 transposase [Portunus trituberculatus]